MSSRWIIALAVVLLLGVFTAAGLFVCFGSHLFGGQNSSLIGTLLGSFLGVVASAFIWFLTHWQKIRETEKSKEAFREVLWTELGGLQDVAYREAQWWQNELTHHQFGETEARLFAHIQAGLLKANLSRITDVPIRAADALVTLQSTVVILHDSFRQFYPSEDKLIDQTQKKIITTQHASGQMKANKEKIFNALIRIAAQARYVERLLDEGHKFEKKRRASFSANEWSKREKEEAEMNVALDAVQF